MSHLALTTAGQEKKNLYNLPFLMVNLEKKMWSMQWVIFPASGSAAWFIKPWSETSILSHQPSPWLTRIITSQRGSQTAQWMYRSCAALKKTVRARAKNRHRQLQLRVCIWSLRDFVFKKIRPLWNSTDF